MATTTTGVDPGYANALPDQISSATISLSQNNSHNLVPGYDGKLGRTGAARDFVQLSVADPAYGNPDQQLLRTWAGYRYPIRDECWFAGTHRHCPVQSHGAHLAGNV